MKIAEERTLAARAIGQSVEFSKKRIGEIARFRSSGTTAEDGSRSGAQIATIFPDEMLPSRFTVFHAGGCESQILEVQGGKVFIELFSGNGPGGQPFLGAAFEGSNKRLVG